VLVNSAKWVVLVLATLPLAYYTAAIVCAMAFFRQWNQGTTDFCPPVSILKPVRGLDRETYRNLASFCRQQYLNYELLFCVDESEDPAVPIIQGLIAEFPQLPIRLLIGTRTVGSNNKVAKLCRLAAEASHDLLVVSDADIRVEPDYLRHVVAPFCHESVGAVTCLYRGITEPSLWSELEDAAITSNFVPGVLVAWNLRLRFALGATMAVRRQALAEIGGFEALANVAADDYELGRQISARGYRVEIAHTIVETECVGRSFVGFFRHHLRRAVVNRESQPLGHLGFLFAQGLPWTILAITLTPSRVAAVLAAAYMVLRLGVAFTVGVWGLHDRLVRRKWWLVLFDDALGFVVWLVSLIARRVVWQGSVYNVRHGYLAPDERQ
jgi:ceramide glucosyltransferase